MLRHRIVINRTAIILFLFACTSEGLKLSEIQAKVDKSKLKDVLKDRLDELIQVYNPKRKKINKVFYEDKNGLLKMHGHSLWTSAMLAEQSERTNAKNRDPGLR